MTVSLDSVAELQKSYHNNKKSRQMDHYSRMRSESTLRIISFFTVIIIMSPRFIVNYVIHGSID